jgi:hypothetical protein
VNWENLSPPQAANASSNPPAVSMSWTGTGAHGEGCYIVLRPHLLQRAEWLARGKLVSVQIGKGDMLGKLRVVPGDGFRIAGTGGGFKAKTCMVRLSPLPNMAPAKIKPREVLYAEGDSELIITLPSWLFAPVRAGQPTPPPVAAPRQVTRDPDDARPADLAKPGPFRGALTTKGVTHPLVEARRAAR